MCMNNFHAEKLIFDKFTAFIKLAICFTISHNNNNDHSAYSEINIILSVYSFNIL